MMTVVDQASPWFTPSSRLAATTQLHEGAHHSRSGTGRPKSHPTRRILRRPTRWARSPAARLAAAFVSPSEGHQERQGGGRRSDAELLLGQERQHGSLHADHGADEGVHQYEERELAPVLRESQADGFHRKCGTLSGSIARKVPPARPIMVQAIERGSLP